MLQTVLFDWRGTLVHDPPLEWWVATALRRIGRRDDVPTLRERISRAFAEPEVAALQARCDCSRAAHDEWFELLFACAGLDSELGRTLDALDLEPESHPLDPDVAPVFAALHAASVRIAVVSDVHFDLRPEFAAANLDVDTFALSYEHGVQKPHRAMFEIAIEDLGVEGSGALMVGDRASHDGGAVQVGIPTPLLPPVESAQVPVGLERVLAFIDG